MRKSRQLKPWLRNPEDTEENPLTRERLISWMASTNFIEGYLGSKSQAIDAPYYEEYIQEVWLQICEIPEKKLLEIWYRGKGKFTNYMKSLIRNNILSTSSPLYQHIRQPRLLDTYLDDVGWNTIKQELADDTYEEER